MDDSMPGDLRDATVWKEAGDTHFHKGEFDSAKKCYAHAIEIDPAYEAAWNNLGFTFMKLGQVDEAKQINDRLKMMREKKTHIDPNIAPIVDLPEFSTQESGGPSSLPAGQKRPGIAALLSAIFPGLGQVYNGENLKGVLVFLGFIAGIVFMLIPGIIVWVVGIADAYRNAKRMNAGTIPSRPTNRKNMVFFAGGVIVLTALLLIIAAYVYGSSGPVYQSVFVTMQQTPDGMNMTWQGGADFNLVTGWKVIDYSSGKEVVLLDGTGHKPTIGQRETYTGGSLTGKKILVRAWFSDGTEEVIYDRQF